ERPSRLRHLMLWLSPDDLVRLIEAAIAIHNPGYIAIWGVSNNTRGVLSLEEGRTIGYEPRDDAEQYISTIDTSSAAAEQAEELQRLGGKWTSQPVGIKHAPLH